MTWTYNLDLADAPLVLAGPILRKTTRDTVTVWFALKNPATVTLTVGEEDGNGRLIGARTATKIGPNLYIVAVTATVGLPGTRRLQANRTYFYDASFFYTPSPSSPGGAPPPPQTMPNLVAATKSTRLSYFGSDGKPAFRVPGSDPRIMHGSCRKPHGEGEDALALLDDLIKEDPSRNLAHQLILTGSQIYADDVSAGLLMMVMGAANKLLGRETLPLDISGPLGGDPIYASVAASEIPPMQRSWYARPDVGFTAHERRNHLLYFGEYICMYLFAWSDVLWGVIPDLEDIRRVSTVSTSVLPDSPGKDDEIARIKGTVHNEGPKLGRLYDFKETLWKVRRVLANVPTAMIFNDHDITDDFNMTRANCEAMYEHGFGRRVIQNGLLAYALCQHWGNVPEDFIEANPPPAGEAPPPGQEPPPPGHQLLELVSGNVPPDKNYNLEMERLLGIHPSDTLRSRPQFAVFHEQDSLHYDYVIEGPVYQILVTDTRTWRAFPENSPAAHFLPPAQLTRQVAQAGLATNGRALIVVLSTNAPTIRSLRQSTQHPDLAQLAELVEPRADAYDHWEPGSPAYDRLLRAISDRFPVTGEDEDRERKAAVTILSGDVNSSCTSQAYFLGRRFEEAADAPPTKLMVAHLVGSSLNNENAFTMNLHRLGPTYPEHILGPRKLETFAGWNTPDSTRLPIGTKEVRDPVSGAMRIVAKAIKTSTTFKVDELETGFDYNPPDYGYYLKQVYTEGRRPSREYPLPGVFLGKDPSFSADYPNRRAKLSAAQKKILREIAVASEEYDPGGDEGIVGVNNIAGLRFISQYVPSDTVVHSIYWREPRSRVIATSQFTADLDPDSTTFVPDVTKPPVP